MSIVGNTGIGRDGLEKKIVEWLNNRGIYNNFELISIQNYPLFAINIKGVDVNLFGYNDSSLPDYIIFNEIIGGNFICSYSSLNSMRGFPKKVGRNFDISFSRILSLDDVPISVDIDFVACGLPFSEQQIREKTNVTCRVYC